METPHPQSTVVTEMVTITETTPTGTIEVTEVLKTSGGGAATAVEDVDVSQLTQFIGLSLRAILPYAEREVQSIDEVARRDNDETARAEAADGDHALKRARIALDTLNKTELSIANFDDAIYDEDFQVVFEDDASDTKD